MKASVVIEKVLETLQGGAEATVEIINVMTSSYGESRRKISRSLKYGGRNFKSDWAESYRNRQKFYNLLNYLKKQGFVESKKREKKSVWKITKKGLEKLDLLKERNLYSRENARYEEGKSDSNFKIIVYDIPVNEGNKKRDWLRAALKNLGFTMLQRSVWVGKRKIPEEFLNDLHQRKMLKYVQIFEVAREGTLREIT